MESGQNKKHKGSGKTQGGLMVDIGRQEVWLVYKPSLF